MRIAITGHRPDSFLVSHYQPDSVKRRAGDVLCALRTEYGTDVSFNIGGAVGADQWVAAACVENNIKFHLYLPFLPEVQARHWSDEQRDELTRLMQHAESIEITDPSGDYNVARYHERDRRMVDDASFVVAFWVGQRRGGTYNTMKYALSQSKFVFNALNHLRPVFGENLNRGWTPPTVKGSL